MQNVIRKILGVACIVTPLYFASATQTVFADALQDSLNAIESTTPTPASEAPNNGTFWSAQFGDKMPPLPLPAMDLPFWSLGGGIYVYDDLDVDYPAMWGPVTPPQQAAVSR